MDVRVPTYAPVVLFLSLATAACGTSAAPTSPTATAGAPLAITAEPAAIRPERLAGEGCAGGSAFGLRLALVVQGRSDVILRDVRFEFLDRFGRRTLPAVSTLPEPGSTNIPASSPVPVPGPGTASLPGAGPVTIPGASPIHGLLLSGERSSTIRFFLALDCGSLPEGTLVVIVNAADTRGAATTSQMRLAVSD